MLSCLLTANKLGIDPFKNNLFRLNNDSPLFDDVQSISLQTKCNNQKNPKFPIINRINGWLSSSNQNASNSLEVSSSQKLKSFPITKQDVQISDTHKDKISVVFVRNNQNKVCKLTFNTVQCTVIPLYAEERVHECSETDKKIQPYSKSFFHEEYTPHLSRLNTRRKAFKVNQKNDGRVSIMSFKNKIGQPRVTEPRSIKNTVGISASKTNLKKSVVYLTVHNISFKLHPKMMTLDFSKPIVSDHLRQSLARDLGLETHHQKKNKGSIIAKCYGDILKFTFNMEDINYQHIPEMITRSCQIKDDSVYIRCFSEISERIVHVPLPRNIYNYKDPMVDIKRRNKTLKLNHIEPLWMSETRKNRLMSNRLCQQVDPAQKAYEATNGSSIVYEGQGTFNKAREGLIPCEILAEDRKKYERWITRLQNDNLHQTINEGDEFEKFDSIGNHDVPDWDLIVYTK